MKKIILTLLIALPITVFAAPKSQIEKVKGDIKAIEAVNTTCHDGATSNLAMKICEADTGVALDKVLNREYKAIMNNEDNFDTGFPGSGDILKDMFRDSQRKWLKFRESNCSWQSTTFYGGTGQGLIYSGCSNRMTKNRIVEMVEHYYFDSL